MERTCKFCKRRFETSDRVQDNPGAEAQVQYCSDYCQKAAENKRYYAAHRETVIDAILARRKEQRKKKRAAR